MHTALAVDEILGRFRHECLFMKELKHENIVMLIGALWQKDLICCVLEYCERGNLSDYLEANPNLSWQTEKLRIMQEIARGMNYLHTAVFFDSDNGNYKEGLVHRDLKPDNILVSAGGTLKISDFGESRMVNLNQTMTMVGTLFYTAPEILRGERYDQLVDVYSFGMTLATVCCCGSLQELLKEALRELMGGGGGTLTSARINNKLRSGKLKPKFPDNNNGVPDVVLEVINDCLNKEASERPTFGELLGRLCEGGDIHQVLQRNTKDEIEAGKIMDYWKVETAKLNVELEKERRGAQEKLKGRIEAIKKKRNLAKEIKTEVRRKSLVGSV